MKKKSSEIPESVLACIWFANPERLDWNTQKEIVITQVLNRGTWDAVKWVYHYYGEEAIRYVASHPKRGLWFPQALQFWSLFFRLSLKPSIVQKALFRLAP